MAHDADDDVAGAEARVRRRRDHAAERFVPDHQALVPGSGLAVAAIDQLAIGAADAEGERAHEDRALGFRRLGDVLQALGARLAGLEGYGAHIGVTTARRH